MDADVTNSPAAMPPLAISACTTMRADFHTDLTVYRAAGVGGIGLWEQKLPDSPDEGLKDFVESGLSATFCFPMIKSLLPGDAFDRAFGQPSDPRERRGLLRRGIERLRRFDPVAVVCLTGPPDPEDMKRSRQLVVERLREASDIAGECGAKLVLEVIRGGERVSLANTIPKARGLIEDAQAVNVDLLIDVWHLDPGPELYREIRDHIASIAGIQVCDRPPAPRSNSDRVLPGKGVIDLAGFLRGTREAGYKGWYEIEIISDDGMLGAAYPDSLWKLDPTTVVEGAVAGFGDAWRASHS
jgi:sugar phosphate isomerase/epimerase